jgi:integrase
MAILAQCPICRTKQKVNNKRCRCGGDLDKAKKANRVQYWVSYYLPGGKNRREPVGFSIDEARDAEGKRRAQKREGRFFEMLPETKKTFNQLVEWYLNLESVKALASYEEIVSKLEKFNAKFGTWKVGSITAADLKNYQASLKADGLKPGTIDHDIGKVKTMVNAAFIDGKVGASTYRAFKATKKALVKGSDVRDRVLSSEEFDRLMMHSKGHTRGIIAMAYFTGMRRGEILGLTWDRVDLKKRLIYLEARHTKDKEPRKVPICAELLRMLQEMPSRITESVKERHVFTYQGEPLKGNIRAGIRCACKLAGLAYGRNSRDGLTLHDLRHTFTTNMRRAGVPEVEIMAITGHSSRSTFDRYSKVDESDIQRAIDRMGVFLKNSDQNRDQRQKEDPAEAGSLDVTT